MTQLRLLPQVGVDYYAVPGASLHDPRGYAQFWADQQPAVDSLLAGLVPESLPDEPAADRPRITLERTSPTRSLNLYRTIGDHAVERPMHVLTGTLRVQDLLGEFADASPCGEVVEIVFRLYDHGLMLLELLTDVPPSLSASADGLAERMDELQDCAVSSHRSQIRPEEPAQRMGPDRRTPGGMAGGHPARVRLERPHPLPTARAGPRPVGTRHRLDGRRFRSGVHGGRSHRRIHPSTPPAGRARHGVPAHPGRPVGHRPGEPARPVPVPARAGIRVRPGHHRPGGGHPRGDAPVRAGGGVRVGHLPGRNRHRGRPTGSRNAHRGPLRRIRIRRMGMCGRGAAGPRHSDPASRSQMFKTPPRPGPTMGA